MAYQELVRSHVERCLQDIWDVRQPEQDADGDYPFRSRSSVGWVRIEAPTPTPTPTRVFAHAAYAVKLSAGLLKELNALNAQSRLTSVSWSGGVVSVGYALPGELVDRTSLRLALDAVSCVADDISELTAAVFGGQVPARPREDAEG